jgi:teichuronic acid biosynthesis glycosyltransferase TuaC
VRVLIVCSGNAKNFSFQINQAFIYDQIETIKKIDPTIEFGYFFIKGKGRKGYLQNLKLLKIEMKKGNYNFIHAHSGDSVLLASLQRIIPVIGTYHGSDLNKKKNRLLSNIANILSKSSIVVSPKLHEKLWFRKQAHTIPCGVDFDLFYPENQQEVRKRLDISLDKTMVLFSSAFANPVKNYELAEKAIRLLNKKDLIVMELKGYERYQIRDLMNAADISLMTSFSEGSPQFIKEAMACNIPIVSTDVGDVKDNIENTEGCFMTSFEIEDVADKIEKAILFNQRTNGRENISFLDNTIISKKIIDIYKSI